MKRIFIYLITLVLTTSGVHAQIVMSRTGVLPTSKPPKNAPREIRLTVAATAEPLPALKYNLLPNLMEQTRGNAALLYYRMMDRIEAKRDRDSVRKWLEMPRAKLPLDEVARFLQGQSVVLREVRMAARREDCDFQYPIAEEGISVMLPSLGKYRHLAKVLALQARVQVARGQHTEAIETIKTGMGLARHLGRGKTLIEALVGIAISALMLEEAQGVVASPGGPNLYWALTELPRPMVDLGTPMEYESLNIYFSFPGIWKIAEGLPEGALRIEQWRKLLAGFTSASHTNLMQARLAATAIAVKLYPAAKKYMMAKGKSKKEVEAMPPEQVVAVFSYQGFLRLRDNMFKWFNLPYWQAYDGFRAAQQELHKANATMEGYPFTIFLPSLGRAYLITCRIDRKIAALRCIEAVRMYAADNGGKLPTKLEDITQAPIPINPITGKAFGYSVSGRSFTLVADDAPNSTARDTIHYIVTLTDKKAR